MIKPSPVIALATMIAAYPQAVVAQRGANQIGALAPATPWKVDYAERECRLTRSFGKQDNAILFRLARGTSFSNYDIMLAGLSIPKQSNNVSIIVTLSPQSTEESFKGENRDIPNRRERILRWFDGETASIIAGPKNQEMDIVSESKFSIRLDMENFPAALSAMQACHDDLLKGWGIDGAAIRALKSLPEPKSTPAAWATTGDYPGNLLRSETGGDVSFKLDVDAVGTPTDCAVIVTSKVEQLDKLTCKLMMQRARFRPALDANGLPASAHYINRVRWQVPN